jgi:hypothetical protein
MEDNDQLQEVMRQMYAAASANDQQKANQLLAKVAASVPQGQAATPRLADPLQDEVRANSVAVRGPVAPSNADSLPQSNPQPLNVAASLPPDVPSKRPMVQGGIPAGQNPVPRPQVGGLPGLLLNLFSDAHRAGGTPQGMPVPSKLNSFENFLGTFLTSLAAGYSQEGHGPGSGMRGAAAAIQAPYQQSLQQYQLGQQSQANQAQIDATESETALRRAQAQQMGQMVSFRDPISGQQLQMPYSIALKSFPQVFGAEARKYQADVSAQTKLSVAEMQAQIAAGKIAHVYPVKDASGNITGMQGYGAQGQPLGILQGAVPPASLFGKTRFTQNQDGSYSTTTTTPNIPGATSSGKAGNASQTAVTGAGATGTTKITRSTSPEQKTSFVGQMEQSTSPLDQQAVALVNGDLDPSQLAKRGATYNVILGKAMSYSMARDGVPFNSAQAASDYKYANNSTNQNTLKMIQGMTEPGGAIEIAKTAFNAIPGKVPVQAINQILDGTMTQFGGTSVVGFRTAMLGLADEYSKVMGGGVSSDTGREQALNIIKEAYSKGQGAEAIQIMQKDLDARKKALIGDNRYLKRQYGVTTVQTSDHQTIEIPTKNLFQAKQRDPKLKILGEK